MVDNIITDHAARTVALLIEQFRKNPRMSGLVSAVANQLQESENILSDLITLRSISLAAGVPLDNIGVMIGIPRTGQNDTQYRSDIYFQIATNNSQATPETLIAILQRVTNGTISYTEYYPAAIQMEISGALLPIPSNVLQQMERIKPAGVKLTLMYNDSATPFVFGVGSGSSFSPAFTGLGFGETTSGSIDNSGIGGDITEQIGV